jgi:hypothetical protein
MRARLHIRHRTWAYLPSDRIDQYLLVGAEEWGALFGGEVHDEGGGAGGRGVGVRDAVDEVLCLGIWGELYSVGVLKGIEVGTCFHRVFPPVDIAQNLQNI